MRILVVEDDRRIAADIATTLGAAGYVVDTVEDGEEAWFRGDTEDYDLIVLDLGLPKMDGLAALKRWRAAGRGMPILVLTARGTWAERVEGINAGADDYLPKPFRMEELLARIRALIRRSAGVGTTVIEVASRHESDAAHQRRHPGRALAAGIQASRVSHASQGARRFGH